jgi:hypothetical protein
MRVQQMHAQQGEEQMAETPRGFKPENQQEDVNALEERLREERLNMHQRHESELIGAIERHRHEMRKLEQRHEHERRGGSRRSADDILA